MNEQEKVIEIIQIIRAEVDPDIGGLSENDCPMVAAMLDDAIALLSPVEPIEGRLAGSVYSIYRCGNCKGWLRINDKFCGACGRRIKRDG